MTRRRSCYVSAYELIHTHRRRIVCSHTQVDNRGSLENVSTKWLAEINEHCPDVKIVLCALKCDLREEHEKDDAEGPQLIQYNEGLEVAKQIGALRYLGTWFRTYRPRLH